MAFFALLSSTAASLRSFSLALSSPSRLILSNPPRPSSGLGLLAVVWRAILLATELEVADDVDENSGIWRVCSLPYMDEGLLKRVCLEMNAEGGDDSNASAADRFIPVDTVVNSGAGTSFDMGGDDDG